MTTLIYKWNLYNTTSSANTTFYYEKNPLEITTYATDYTSTLQAYTHDISTTEYATDTTITLNNYVNIAKNTHLSNNNIILTLPSASLHQNEYYVIVKYTGSSSGNISIRSTVPLKTLTDDFEQVIIKSNLNVSTWEWQEITLYNTLNDNEIPTELIEVIYKWQSYNTSSSSFVYQWSKTTPGLTGSRKVAECSNYTTSKTDITNRTFGYTFYDLDTESSNYTINLPPPSEFMGKYLFFRKSGGSSNLIIAGGYDTTQTYGDITITTTGDTLKFKSIIYGTTIKIPIWQQLQLSNNEGEDYVNLNGYIFNDANISLNANIKAKKLNGLQNKDTNDDKKILIYNDTENSLNMTTVKIESDNRISNVSDPINPQDVVTKKYVDEAVAIKPTGDVIVASTMNYNLTEIDANTFTFTAPAPTEIDGILLADLITIGVDEKRILLKDQTNQIQNGIYLYDNIQLTRIDTFNQGDAVNSVLVNVLFGESNKLKGYICVSPVGVDIVGDDEIIFESFGLFEIEPYCWFFTYAPLMLAPELSVQDEWSTLNFNVNYDSNNPVEVTLSSNKFLCNPGTYKIDLQGIFHGTGNTIIRLLNITDSKIYDFSVSVAPYLSQDPYNPIPILFSTVLNVNGLNAKLYEFQYKTSNVGYIYSPNFVAPTENSSSAYEYDYAGPVGSSLTASTNIYTYGAKCYSVSFLKLS